MGPDAMTKANARGPPKVEIGNVELPTSHTAAKDSHFHARTTRLSTVHSCRATRSEQDLALAFSLHPQKFDPAKRQHRASPHSTSLQQTNIHGIRVPDA